MLYESNKATYFISKYTPLAVSALLLINVIYPFFSSDLYERSAEFYLMTIMLLTLSTLAYYIFFKLKPKWKIVALNRWKIVVDEDHGEQEYTWLEVEAISLNRLLAFYTLRFKNGREIFFKPYGLINIFTGDTSEMGVIINKTKRDLSL